MPSIADTTLLEQMHVSDHEIALRKRLFDFTEKDVANLVSCREWIAAHIDEVIEEVFRRRLAEPEIALVIGDHDSLERLKEEVRGSTYSNCFRDTLTRNMSTSVYV